MAVNVLTINKINQISKKNSKKNIEANVLHVLNLKQDMYDNRNFREFQFKAFHEGQFSKSIEFIRELSNQNLDIEKYSNDSLQVFKANENLLASIELEKKFLQSEKTKILKFNKNNKDLFEKIYNVIESNDIETLDFFSGHFLLFKNLTNLFTTFTTTFQRGQALYFAANPAQSRSFENENIFEYSIKNVKSLLKDQQTALIDFGSVFLNYILTFKTADVILDWDNLFFEKMLSFCKNYLGFQLEIDKNNKKIKNFKKYPLSIGILGQSIYNLLEQESFMSMNSLFYGILPIEKINENRLQNFELTNLPFYSNNQELLQLKYIDVNDIIDFTKNKSINSQLNAAKLKYSFNLIDVRKEYKKSDVELNNNQKLISSLNNANLKNLLNIDGDSDLIFSNISLLSNENEQNELGNIDLIKFKIFKDARVFNNIRSVEDESLPIINQVDPANFSNLKKHTLNLINLIGTNIDNNNLHILEHNQDGSFRKKSLVNSSSRGMHNYNFLGNDLQSSILKNRLLSDFIVKGTKKRIIYLNASLNPIRFSKILLSNPNQIQDRRIFSKVDFQNELKTIEDYILFESLETADTENTNQEINSVSLNKNFILNGENKKQSLIEKNISSFSGIENINKEIINVDKQLTEQEIKDYFNTQDLEKLNQISDSLYDSDNLQHFVNSSTFFERITKFCKDYIEKNTDINDHRSNFQKRANIAETATLLWIFHENSKGLTNESKEEIKKNIIDTILQKRAAISAGVSSLPPDSITKREAIFNQIKNNLELISGITPFYLFGNNLNDDYSFDNQRIVEEAKDRFRSLTSNYNPNSNKAGSDAAYIINEQTDENLTYEQNGLFYNFLFSNYHQEKSYALRINSKDVTTIEEYENCNNLNFNNLTNHFFSFNENNKTKDNESVDSLLRKMSIKNVFNSGYNDYKILDNLYNTVMNAYIPKIYLDKYKEKFSFFITHECNHDLNYSQLKNKFGYLFNLISRYNNASNGKNDAIFKKQLLMFKNCDTIKDNISSFIQKKYIMNIATPSESFFNINSDNFFDSFVREIFASVLDFDLEQSDFTKYINAAFMICADVFCRMYIDLQNHTNLCNRLHDSSVFTKGFKQFLTLENSGATNAIGRNENISDIDVIASPFVYHDNLENLNNFYSFDKNFNIDLSSGSFSYCYRTQNDYYNYNVEGTADFDTTNSFFEKENIIKQREICLLSKPSFKKLYHCLSSIFGLEKESLNQIFLYIFSNADILSKNNFIFNLFNLHSIKNKNYFFLENASENSQPDIFFYTKNIRVDGATGRDCKDVITFINDSNLMFFDYLYERNLQDQKKYNDILEGLIRGNIFSNNIQQDQRSNYGHIGYINKVLKEDLRNSYALSQIIESNSNSFNANLWNNGDSGIKLIEFFKKINEIFSFTYGIDKKFENQKSIYTNDITNGISQNEILQNIIFKSYTNSRNYNLQEIEMPENAGNIFYVKSGCDNILTNSSNFLYNSNENSSNKLWLRNNENKKFQTYIQKNNSVIPGSAITDKKMVDINNNWYNHILRGLIINDFSHSLSLDIVKYFNSYENGVGKDIYAQYEKLKNNRNQKNSYYNQSINEAKDKIKEKTGFNYFYLTNDNIKLKDSYVSQFFKTKMLKDFKDAYSTNGNDIQRIVQTNILFQNDIAKNFFKDPYIEQYFKNFDPNNPLNENDIKDSTIITVGIEKNIEFKKNDIILVTVEMTDHDYPWIIWENKTFEFDPTLENPHDFAIGNLNINQIPDVFFNQKLKFPLIDYQLSSNEINTSSGLFLRKLVPAVPNILGSLIDNPDLNIAVDINEDIQKIIDKRKFDLYESIKRKLDLIGLEKTIEERKLLYIENIVKRSIYHQLNSYKLEKILKFVTGFEPKKQISLEKEEEKFLNRFYVSNDVYELYVNNIFQNIFNVERNGFTLKELESAFSTSETEDPAQFPAETTYKGHNFKIATLSTNHNLNIFLKFMHDFTKMLLPDHKMYVDSNFSKVLNISLKPDDFFISSIRYNDSSLPGFATISNLAINGTDGIQIPQLNDNENIQIVNFNRLNDTFKNNYISLNYEIYKQQGLDIKYYNFIDTSTRNIYKPKNVSYRVKIDLIEI